MFIVILIYDQLIFRPLVAWSQKFKSGDVDDENAANSWIYDVFQRSRWFQVFCAALSRFVSVFVNLRFFDVSRARLSIRPSRWVSVAGGVVYYAVLFSL